MPMKYLIPITTALCLSLNSFAQVKSPRVLEQSPKRGWFSLTAGLAIPTGDFGSTSLTNENAGLAKMGFAMNADLAVPFTQHFGSVFSFNGSLNQGDADAVKSVYKMFTGMTPEVSFTSWKQGALLAGLYIKTTSVNGKPMLFAKVQGGYALTQSPEADISIRYGGYYASSKQNSALAGAFVFNGGVGLMIPLASGPSIQLGVNYITMRSTFKDVEANATQTSPTSPTQYSSAMSDFSMTISNLMVQGGLAWSLH
jgi:hypothetical protein